MLFGLTPPGAVKAAQIAAAKDRLQSRLEQDPSVPSMQSGGFVWGAAGQRLTPDEIAARQRTANQNMAAGMDTSPVEHWTQGAARLTQAIAGSLQQGRLVKAAAANTAERDSIAKLLVEGGKGQEPGAYEATLMGAAANPYLDATTRALAEGERQRVMKANAPEYFMSGSDRVRYDPVSGEAKVVYDAPEDFQTYAAAMGYAPGTPEYNTAAQDYVLRGNGPTAFQYDAELEGERHGNRVALEGLRQGNRLQLRGTPTYSDLHPRPRAGGGGGRGGSPSASRQATMAGTMAPILAKVSRGEKLTPGEQQAWNMYRPPSRGRGKPSPVAAALAGGEAGGGGLPRPNTRADFAKLPKGAKFIDPQGTVRVK